MNDSVQAIKTTRSILVIEEEYNLRVLLLNALSAERWNVMFALTEDAIAVAVREVAGVILNWDAPALLDSEKITKMIGNLPIVIAEKPYEVSKIILEAYEKVSKDRFFVGDQVVSKITPDWGMGRVVSIYPNGFYGVVFNSGDHRHSSEIAMRCHFTGLKWSQD